MSHNRFLLRIYDELTIKIFIEKKFVCTKKVKIIGFHRKKIPTLFLNFFVSNHIRKCSEFTPHEL